MDTGSEFAYLMSKLVTDTFKDVSAILKEIIMILYQNKTEREKHLLSSFNFEELAKNAKNFEAVNISKDSLEKFSEVATKMKFKHTASGLGEDIIIIYDKNDMELLKDVLKEVEKQKSKSIAEPEKDGLNKKIEKIVDGKQQNTNDHSRQVKSIEENLIKNNKIADLIDDYMRCKPAYKKYKERNGEKTGDAVEFLKAYNDLKNLGINNEKEILKFRNGFEEIQEKLKAEITSKSQIKDESDKFGIDNKNKINVNTGIER